MGNASGVRPSAAKSRPLESGGSGHASPNSGGTEEEMTTLVRGTFLCFSGRDGWMDGMREGVG